MKRIENAGIQRAAVYIRVSTEEQAMRGLSLQAQQETLLQYVSDNGLKLAGIYADQGITARKKYRNRTEFMRMINDVQAGNVDVILFIKLDRWFRNIADYYEVQKILDANNVQWIATEENYDTTTANGRLHLNIKLSIAQDESDRTSERIKFVFDSKRKRGEVTSGRAPFGYRIVDKRLQVDPDTAPIARDFFERYLALRSVKALARYAVDQYDFFHTDRGWRLMLQNERYIGKAFGQPDFCEPIIDTNTFQKVQQIIAERSQRHSAGKNTYLFSGLLYCSECGGRMSAYTGNKRHVYYRCSGYVNKRPCPNRKQINELVIEDWLLKNIVSKFAEYNLALDNKPKKAPSKQSSAKIKSKMEKLKDLYLSDLIDRDIYERDYTTLRAALDEAERPDEAPANPVPLDAIKAALDAYTGLSFQVKRELLSNLIGRIVFAGGSEFFIFPS